MGYRFLVPPVRDYGRSAPLNIERGRRLRSIGTSSLEEALGPSPSWWTHADAMDYARDAPDEMPAGSCIDADDFPEQRTVRREPA
jgi:hypothetical protein